MECERNDQVVRALQVVQPASYTLTLSPVEMAILSAAMGRATTHETIEWATKSGRLTIQEVRENSVEVLRMFSTVANIIPYGKNKWVGA